MYIPTVYALEYEWLGEGNLTLVIFTDKTDQYLSEPFVNK